jgi:hypothetical protein
MMVVCLILSGVRRFNRFGGGFGPVKPCFLARRAFSNCNASKAIALKSVMADGRADARD